MSPTSHFNIPLVVFLEDSVLYNPRAAMPEPAQQLLLKLTNKGLILETLAHAAPLFEVTFPLRNAFCSC